MASLFCGTRPHRTTAAAAFLALFLGMSCIEFSPPVEEKLDLRFLPDGTVAVTVETLLADTRTSFQTNEPAKARIQETQDETLAQRDPWSRRFGRAEWAKDSVLLERACGRLVRARREGTLADPSALAGFLRDLPFTVAFSRDGGEAELALYPQAPVAATQEQREALAAYLERWIPDLRAYLRAEADLYAYLASHPDRARPCFAVIFEGCTPGGKADRVADPEGEEKKLLDRLGESLGKVLEALEVGDKEAYSPDELSRICSDPLPAPLTVEVPGQVLLREGFEASGPGRVIHRGRSLWAAVESLAGRWVSPDLLTPVASCLLREGAEKHLVDLDGFAARKRNFDDVPSEEELRRSIDEALGPAPVYRVRWREVRKAGPETSK